MEYVCNQIALPRELAFKKMFGEYALYLNGQVVALVCDNQLYVKPTPEGRSLLGAVAEHSPFPSAKPHFRIDGELENQALLQRLLRVTAAALPAPKPRSAKPRKSPVS